jgi:hypothetical protein
MSRLDDDALRALVREAVARRIGMAAAPASECRPVSWSAHASHARYGLPESDGPCLIEPSVPCTHCGYCQSHGH